LWDCDGGFVDLEGEMVEQERLEFGWWKMQSIFVLDGISRETSELHPMVCPLGTNSTLQIVSRPHLKLKMQLFDFLGIQFAWYHRITILDLDHSCSILH
jgi:hypothetical protein